MSDKVELRLNAKSVRNLISYSLRYDIFEGAASFTAEIDFDWILPLQAYIVNFEWFINDEKVMVGFLDKVEKSYSKNSKSMTISGRDYCSILIDNYIIAPKTYENKSIKDIISDVIINNSSVTKTKWYADVNSLTGPYQYIKSKTPLYVSTPTIFSPERMMAGDPISATFYELEYANAETYKQLRNAAIIWYSRVAENQMAKIGKLVQVRSDYGQTLFDFINDMCNTAGLYLYNPAGTNTILVHGWNTPDSDPVGYTKEGEVSTDKPYPITNRSKDSGGNNVISCTFTEDISKFYNFIRIVGQTQAETTLDAGTGIYLTKPNELQIEKIIGLDAKGFRGLGSFYGPTKFLTKETNAADLNIWKKTKDSLMNNQVLEQNRKLYSIKYTVAEHSPSGSTPYYTNHLVNINDDLIPMTNATFLVYGVEFSGDKNQGRRTTLTCALSAGRNTYTDQTFGNPKWDLGLVPGATEDAGAAR